MSVVLSTGVANATTPPEITHPEDDADLMAGSTLDPEGIYDSTLEEFGPVTLRVEYYFLKPGQPQVAIQRDFDADHIAGYWWVKDVPSVMIPGGDYIGGTWRVIVVSNGQQTSHSGKIIASEE